MIEIADAARTASLAVAALMPIVNPPGAAPIFLSMSADLPTPARRQPTLVPPDAWEREVVIDAMSHALETGIARLIASMDERVPRL